MSDARHVATAELRRRFSSELSSMYAAEVPLYGELMAVVKQVNREVVAARPELSLDEADVDRLSAERHGAIRLGRDDELALMTRFFAVLGMEPVDCYDLSAAGAKAQPVIATAFRPASLDEIEVSPFRVFCSLLRPEDERFFDDEVLRRRMRRALDTREIFGPRLRSLIERAESDGGLDAEGAAQFVEEGLRLFGWRGEARDRALYEELRARGTNIAADICCFPNPHLNHLTPNSLDIDALQMRMTEVLATRYSGLGAEMKDHIEGPPPRRAPVLLRQTSYQALVETVRFDGEETGTHAARFGEIEQRGQALTPEGRARYDEATARVETRRAAGEPLTPELWSDAFEDLPDDLDEIRRRGLGYFVYQATERGRSARRGDRPTGLDALVDAGHVRAQPIRYEDFLPVSAAGIFASNLRQSGALREGESPHSQAELEAILGRGVRDPHALYAGQEARSLLRVHEELGLELAPARRRELERRAEG
jgi:uncharacterized glyoxalase superfamily metalloenzyme YdcJ